MSEFRAIILAAGRGTRMKSDTPKVLHRVAGKPILEYVLDIPRRLSSLKTYVVVGHKSEMVASVLRPQETVVVQSKLLGTADAVRCAGGHIRNFSGHVLILCGDTPLLDVQSIRRLINKHLKTKAVCTILTANIDNPSGYGRMVRDEMGNLTAIREHKDATAQELAIREINSGVYCFQAKALFDLIKKIKLNPKKKEFYLTDIVELLLAKGLKVETLVTTDPQVAFGVNTREDLALCESIIRRRNIKKLMDQGVTVIDPETTYIDAGVRIGRDTVIHPCTVIHQDVVIGRGCSIGPFARLRPGTRLGDRVEVGNFSEISRTKIGDGCFVKHFGFLGDATIGKQTNIGAGVVTANYDGKNKHQTMIGDHAFIGSDAILVAPAFVGSHAMVGANSVLTKGKRVPPGAVAVGVPARIFKKRNKA